MTTSRPLVLLALMVAACGPNDQLPTAPPDSPSGPPMAGPPPVSNNSPPVASFLSPQAGATFIVGDVVPVSVGFTDPDAADTHTCSLDFQVATSAGTVAENAGSGTCTGSNVFSLAGTYTIQFWIMDSQGATATQSITVDVQDPPATPPPPPPPSQPPPPPQNPPSTTGSVHGSGAIGVGTVAPTARDRHRPFAWFELNGGYSRSKKLVGDFVVSIPGIDPLFVGKAESLSVLGTRADLRGTGRLGRRLGSYSFLVTAVDGGANRGQDRLRIKIWNASQVVFDSDPGAPDSSDPTKTVAPGRIVVRP